MPNAAEQAEFKFCRAELFRYIVNGLFATAVHFMVLTTNLEVLKVPSAGLANLIAACFGISASFLGSRYYVFRKRDEHVARQAVKFALLYGAIALLHGLVLFLWSDLWDFNYRSGFLLATGMQVVLSYFGNKVIVFKL